MGIIKDAKRDTAATHAARAIAEGRRVFVYRLNVGATASGWSGPVSGAAEVVESVEAKGWQLQQMTFDGHQSSNGAMLLLFRRAAPMPATRAPGPQPQPPWPPQPPGPQPQPYGRPQGYHPQRPS